MGKAEHTRHEATERPAFTVIVPTHNRPRLLRRALASLYVQDWQDFEVRVVDDGSANADSVAAIVLDDRPHQCHLHRLEPNRGVSAARNLGIAKAQGRWITFLDDDDELLPHALGAIHRLLTERTDLDFTWGGVEKNSADGRPIGKVSWENRNVDAHSHLGAGTGYALTMQREVFHQIGGFDETLEAGVDFELLIRLGQHFHGAPVLDTLVRVHDHEGSRLTDATVAKARSFVTIADRHRAYLACHPGACLPFLLKTARLCYVVGMRREGRRAMFRVLSIAPRRLRSWKTWLCLEAFNTEDLGLRRRLGIEDAGSSMSG